MDSNREDIEERLLLELREASDRLLACTKTFQNDDDESAFSQALEKYSLALQIFTNFVLYGRLPGKS